MNSAPGSWIKRQVDRIAQGKLRENLLQALPFWIASLLAGFIAVGYTKLFGYAESTSLAIIQWHKWMLFVLTPACFVLAWWVITRFDKKAGGSGIPQVMAAIELANPKYNHLVDLFLSIKGIIIKVLSTLLMIFGGGAIGREGPTVQIAGSVFRTVNNWIPASWPRISKKNMIMAGAAAGLAAAFNTPLGGIVFAVEELAKTHISNFKTALFTAVIIAGLTAQGILGPYLYLGYPEINTVSWSLIFLVLVVACLAGLLSSMMSVAILKIFYWKQTFTRRAQHVLYVLGCAIIVALVAYFFSIGILGSGKAEMSRLLFTRDKHIPGSLPFFRILGSITAFTTGAAGGVFAPSLAAGATIGAYISELFRFAGSDANILILSGMVAFLTGVTRSPFTSAILVLEMTDRHSVVFYLMLAGLSATLFANLIDEESLYGHLKNWYVRDALKTEEPNVVKDKNPSAA